MTTEEAIKMLDRLEDPAVDETEKEIAIYMAMTEASRGCLSSERLRKTIFYLWRRVQYQNKALAATEKIIDAVLHILEQKQVVPVKSDGKLTNFERVRPKNIEELATLLYEKDDDLLDRICKQKGDCPFGDTVQPSDCKNCVIEWLKQEADSDG